MILLTYSIKPTPTSAKEPFTDPHRNVSLIFLITDLAGHRTRNSYTTFQALVPFSSLSHRRSFITWGRSSYQIGGSSS